MRYVYTLLLYLLIPFILLRLYWKSRRLPAYRHRILERFSLDEKKHAKVDVWLHAVSLGEVVAATPLIEALLAKHCRVMVTTMTPTGSQHVTKRFGDKVFHQYVPYDLPQILRRFFKKINPRLVVIMETELWPNLIYETKRRNIPLLLANARLSDKAFHQYEMARFLFKPVLEQFTTILAQSEEDAKRFISLGAPSDRVQVLGNMKFDLHTEVKDHIDSKILKEKWGAKRPIVIAASTHDDEERQWLSHFSTLQQGMPDVILLFAPRHPERFQTVYQMSVAQGLKTGRRSIAESIDLTTEVVIVDSLGELISFYQISDYAFVGGSLVPIGGHNVLEPISVQVPVFCGPYMNNSKAICRDLCAANAMVIVDNVMELMSALIDMHQQPAKRQQQITNASGVLEANRGTITRYMEKIQVILA